MAMLPTLRDRKGGWLTIAALVYAFVADIVGFLWLTAQRQQGEQEDSNRVVTLLGGILLSAHGRIVGSYLVHEAAHSSIFVELRANRMFGVICMWLSGCPYADFDKVRKLHIAHHYDRADTTEFDHREFMNSKPSFFRHLVMALEWAYIPAVEIMMHLRTAFHPIFHGDKCSNSVKVSAWTGTIATTILYAYLLYCGALLPHFVAGALVIHFLSMHDCFQHTYEAIYLKEQTYKPGPNGRTAQYEEENTFSTLISVRFPLLNLLSLNFGYHNAHHQKPMVPWYALPDFHNQIYSGNSSSSSKMDGATTTTTTANAATQSKDQSSGPRKPSASSPSALTTVEDSAQILTFRELLHAWHVHRLRRVVEEDYGVVHPPGTPGRAHDFVGALGVSFFTI